MGACTRRHEAGVRQSKRYIHTSGFWRTCASASGGRNGEHAVGLDGRDELVDSAPGRSGGVERQRLGAVTARRAEHGVHRGHTSSGLKTSRSVSIGRSAPPPSSCPASLRRPWRRRRRWRRSAAGEQPRCRTSAGRPWPKRRPRRSDASRVCSSSSPACLRLQQRSRRPRASASRSPAADGQHVEQCPAIIDAVGARRCRCGRHRSEGWPGGRAPWRGAWPAASSRTYRRPTRRRW